MAARARRFPHHLLVLALILVVPGAGSGCSFRKSPADLVVKVPDARMPGDEGYVDRDYRQFALAWHRATLAEAYKLVGDRSKKSDAAVLELLELLAHTLAQTDEAPTAEELLAAADAVWDPAEDEPMVLYAWAVAQAAKSEGAGHGSRLRRAVEGFRKTKYARCRACDAAFRAAGNYAVLENPAPDEKQKFGDAVEIGIKWAAEGAAEPVVTQGGQRPYVEQLGWAIENVLGDWGERLYDAVAAQKGADPWVVEMVGGIYHLNAAWHARGGGVAYTVPEAGWEGFGKHSDLARQHFTKAWELRSDLPEAAAYMVRETMGAGAQPGETTRQWFDRAVKAQFDYEPAYDRYLWSLSPRWGGGEEEQYRFGLECLATNRFDTKVPQQLYWAVHVLSWREGRADIWCEEGVYEKLKTLFEAILNEPSMARSCDAWRTLYAGAAWRTGHYDDAKRMFDAVGDRLRTEFLEWHFGVSPEHARAETLAATGPLGDSVREAEELYRNGHTGEALAIFEGLSTDGLEELPARHVRDRLAMLRIERDLANGEWVDLLPGAGFAGWEGETDQWVVAPDGALELLPAERETVQLTCRAEIGERYEIRSEFEFPSAPGSGTWGFRLNARKSEPPSWVVFSIGRNSWEATLVQEKKPVPLKDVNTVVIQVWDQRANVSVNGEPIFVGAEFPWIEPIWVESQLVLDAGNALSDDQPLRYRSVRVRRLAEPPEGLG